MYTLKFLFVSLNFNVKPTTLYKPKKFSWFGLENYQKLHNKRRSFKTGITFDQDKNSANSMPLRNVSRSTSFHE